MYSARAAKRCPIDTCWTRGHRYENVSIEPRLTVYEMRPGVGEDEASPREIDIDKLMDHVIWLRGYTASRKYEAASIALEQLMLIDSVVAIEGEVLGRSDGTQGSVEGELFSALKETFEDVQDVLQEIFKVVVSFLQVSGSFLLTFASIDFPPAFSSLAGAMSGVVSFDMINAEMFGEAVSDLNYCKSGRQRSSNRSMEPRCANTHKTLNAIRGRLLSCLGPPWCSDTCCDDGRVCGVYRIPCVMGLRAVCQGPLRERGAS